MPSFVTLTAGLMPALFALSIVNPILAAPSPQVLSHRKHLLKREHEHVVRLNPFNRHLQKNNLERRDILVDLDDAAKAVVAQYERLPVVNITASVPKYDLIKRDGILERRSTASIITPSVSSTKYLGASVNDPEQQYINMPSETLPGLATFLLQPTIELGLSEMTTMYNGSGALQLDETTQPYLASMNYQPLFERDGGKGGTVNGNKIFIFCDTQTYSPSGGWTGFTSNSVGVDVGNNAFVGNAPTVQDKLGEFANSVGTMRNWVPFTIGEAAYNNDMGGAQRFGIWPTSSLIPYGKDSALIYAPIVWTNANAVAPAQVMNYVGTTLLLITVPSDGGPVAERIVPLLWSGSGIEWGCIGGIRKLSYPHPDPENWGRIYIIGGGSNGLYLGRVQANQVTDATAYEFWHAGGTWDSTPPVDNSGDTFVNGSYSTADIFYAPKYKTFILVSMNGYASSTFYWQYLMADTAISPTDADDYVENISQYAWSESQTLFTTPAERSYSYGGGMYSGYFDNNDITNGGNSMLLGWTAQTSNTAASGNGLEHQSATVIWG